MLSILAGKDGTQGVHCILQVLHISTADDVDVGLRSADIHLDFLVVKDTVTKHLPELFPCLSGAFIVLDVQGRQ